MSSGGGYSGGMGGYGGGFGGGFGQPPMFGGGFSGGFGQPPMFGGGFGSPYGGGFGQPPQQQYGGFGGGFGQPQPPQFSGGFGQFQPPQFGGGFGLMPPSRPSGVSDQSTGKITFGVKEPSLEFGREFETRGPGNAYARPFPQLQPQPAPRPKFGQPDQPPPGMIRNPDYRGPRQVPEGMFTTMDIRPSEMEFIADPNYAPTGGGRPSNDQFFGNNQTFLPMPTASFLSGWDQLKEPSPAQPAPQQGSYSPYMSPSMMGGLASLFGGMQGGGFQGMFNPQSQAEAQMRAYQQYQQRDPNQPPPGMKLNPTYNAGYAMADDAPLPGSARALSKQQFIPI